MQLEQNAEKTTKPSQDQLSTRQRCFFLQEPIRTVSIGTDDSVCKQVCRISIFSAHDHNVSAPDETLLKETSVGSIVPLTGLKPGDYSVKMNCSSMKTCVSEPDEIRFVVGEQSQQENFMEINLGRIDLYEVKEVAIKEVICKFPRSSWKPVTICMIMLLEALGLKAISWIANRS
ncbi:hypothetical protein O6H91_05G089400 [Diphasiastrum complanatum]|nr:hypothetical protein O6H91_05G089400 [Diphasiastrum complanatum]